MTTPTTTSFDPAEVGHKARSLMAEFVAHMVRVSALWAYAVETEGNESETVQGLKKFFDQPAIEDIGRYAKGHPLWMEPNFVDTHDPITRKIIEQAALAIGLSRSFPEPEQGQEMV